MAFIAVAVEGNFAKAGDRLGIGRSAVSRSVQKLEDQLCIRLVPSGRGSDHPGPGRHAGPARGAAIGATARVFHGGFRPQSRRAAAARVPPGQSEHFGRVVA
ncbi:hypothetical protein G6F66_015189 [Rhizopus arrhizus]|nr:hypothetical protein G6F66_015189 [Rhizopus arrhizus]